MSVTRHWMGRPAWLMRMGARHDAAVTGVQSHVVPAAPVDPVAPNVPRDPIQRTQPTILILSVSAGAGHVRAAQALCAGAAGMAVQTVHLDVMDYVPRWFRRMYTDVYVGMVGKFPHVWGWLYRHMQQAQPSDRVEALRRAFERRQARALLAKIAAMRPAAIICTHFLPAELLAHLPPAQRVTCPVWIQITDFDVHRIWIQPGVAGYLVASEEVAFRLHAAGVEVAAVHVTGLPTMPEFAAHLARRECSRAINLDPARPTVLLMGGGAGVGDLACIAQRLIAIDPMLQLIALTGRNQALRAELALMAASTPGRFVVHGQTAQVERFMACADLIVTKSGGLTSAECLVAGLPMIINAPIPGQEERNADYLVEQGAALKAIDPVTVEYRVRLLLADRARLARMAANAHALGRPDAAAVIMRIVLAQFVRQVGVPH